MNDYSQDDYDDDLSRAFWETRTRREKYCWVHIKQIVGYCTLSGAFTGFLYTAALVSYRDAFSQHTTLFFPSLLAAAAVIMTGLLLNYIQTRVE